MEDLTAMRGGRVKPSNCALEVEAKETTPKPPRPTTLPLFHNNSAIAVPMSKVVHSITSSSLPPNRMGDPSSFAVRIHHVGELSTELFNR
ncbi:hypothetical protein HAX54_020355 [Datura stramonium]|uniref:Uncharacterized protein n=1 Tax=Datura stramonium TaxID=4076 RepID=A0ABS8S2J8_DATST|nr:hypothetical protein [Datura stramonium]